MKKRVIWAILVSIVLICLVTLGCQEKKDLAVEVTADVAPVDQEQQYSGGITELSYSARDSSEGRQYKITLAGEEIILTAKMPKDTALSIERKIKPEDLNDLQNLILEKEIYKWDGFGQDDTDEESADQDFILNVVYADGQKISAQGREHYPNDYDQGNTALADYFLNLAGPVVKFDGTFDGPAQKPTRIVISKIGVDESIIPVGLDASGRIETTQGAWGITWYTAFSSPGWGTNAILTGHHIYNGQAGSFVRLKDLVAGDVMYIHYADGSIGRFIVKTSVSYEATSVPESVMANSGVQRTTVITCGGNRFPQGGYSHRLIVTFESAGRHRG